MNHVSYLQKNNFISSTQHKKRLKDLKKDGYCLIKSDKKTITVGVASFTNLYLSKKMLPASYKRRLIITGQEFSNVDYIYNNNYFEINPNYNDKYLIPKNYTKHSEVKKGKILINEFFTKK